MTINNERILKYQNKLSDLCLGLSNWDHTVGYKIIYVSALKSIFTHSHKGKVKSTSMFGWWRTMIRNARFISPTNHPGSTFQTDISRRHTRRFIRFPTRSSSPDLSHYTVLGLTPLASQAEVKRVYKRLALKVKTCPLLCFVFLFCFSTKSSKLFYICRIKSRKTKKNDY